MVIEIGAPQFILAVKKAGAELNEFWDKFLTFSLSRGKLFLLPLKLEGRGKKSRQSTAARLPASSDSPLQYTVVAALTNFANVDHITKLWLIKSAKCRNSWHFLALEERAY